MSHSLEDEELEAFRIENAVEAALGRVNIVHAPVGDEPRDWPEQWEGKPFANVKWDGEIGDAAVGIQSWQGMCIAGDQSNTILGDVLAARSDPNLMHALLVLCPYTDPNNDPDKGRRDAAILIRKALGLKH